MTPQAVPAIDPEAQTYIFSSRELARLAVYRAAIVAGFYNDELDRSELPRRQSPRASGRHNALNP
jgi:hypothetical protein